MLIIYIGKKVYGPINLNLIYSDFDLNKLNLKVFLTEWFIIGFKKEINYIIYH